MTVDEQDRINRAEEMADEELWSTEVWYKNMMYYLRTEMLMFTGRL